MRYKIYINTHYFQSFCLHSEFFFSRHSKYTMVSFSLFEFILVFFLLFFKKTRTDIPLAQSWLLRTNFISVLPEEKKKLLEFFVSARCWIAVICSQILQFQMFTYREYRPRKYLNLLEMHSNVVDIGIYSLRHCCYSFRLKWFFFSSQRYAH